MTATRSTSAILALGAIALAAPLAAQGGGGGGGGQQQRPPENLQVLRKDMPRDSVVAIMRTFTGALGVRCEYCHAEREGGAPANMAAAPAGGSPAGGGAAGGGAPGGG
ncbi:MAG TPA: hypothetical protein VF483_05330, partial [Gemmatimonadaceae bacterium]